jgi:hypothetical protein
LFLHYFLCINNEGYIISIRFQSQASEEDPEYLIPERPKLVEQEQEHPLKKAWQMQKSRSEEEGPAGFVIKEFKTPTVALQKPNQELENKNEGIKSNNANKPKESDAADIVCNVTLAKQTNNNEIDGPKSSSEIETLSVPSQPEEPHEEELNGHSNVVELEENPARMDRKT